MKPAVVVFDQGRKMLTGAAGSLGKALSRYNEGVEATYGQPGPEIEVTPFAPGTVTGGAILAKLASSAFAAARTRANTAKALERQQLQDRYQQARVAEITGRMNEPTYSYKLPSGETVRGLSGEKRAAIEHQFTQTPGAERMQAAPPPDVLAEMKREGRVAPSLMSRENVSAYRYLRGIKEPLSGAAEKAFDVVSEDQRESMRWSEDNVRKALEAAAAEGIKGGKITSYGLLSPSSSDYAQNHPTVVSARKAAIVNRARQVIISLGNASDRGDFDSMLAGLNLIADPKGDPILGVEGMGPIVTAYLTKARKLATTPQQIEELSRVAGGPIDDILSGKASQPGYVPGR